MATIYTKTGTDQCLVLGPRESLIYPFNVGDWSELRLGAFFSYTSSIGFNDTGYYEAFPSNGGSTNIFWGIKDSGVNFPFSTGTSFIGATNNPSTSPNTVLSNVYTNSLGNPYSYVSSAQSPIGTSNPLFALCISTGTVTINMKDSNVGQSATLFMMYGSGVTGSNNYAMFNGLRFRYNRDREIVSGQIMYNYLYSEGTSDVSVSNLQSKLQALPNLDSDTTTGTWRLTTPLPSAVYIYNPFTTNSIRIHSLLIDRYA